MLDIMLHEPWNDMGLFEWSDDSRDALGNLECVASGTTGRVRQEARKALATIGVAIEEADPLLVFVSDWNAADALETPSENIEAWYATTIEPFRDRAHANDIPAAATAAGAAAALRKALDFECVEDWTTWCPIS